MQNANHILAKEGILTTFSIAKKVTAKDIKKLRDKMKNAKIDAKKMYELLQKSIVKETKKDFESHNIPGLIIDGVETEEEKKRIVELTYFASKMAEKLLDKKIDKYHSCYIINAIVNILKLTEDDFNEFHEKFSKFKNGTDGGDGQPPEETGNFPGNLD